MKKKIDRLEKVKKWVYPCEAMTACVCFLQSHRYMTFAEFSESICAKCNNHVLLDLPYTKDMKGVKVFRNEKA